MSTKSPVYLTYAIESSPPLCQHRKIPQNIQTIYCQEKPIRLEEKTHLRKIGETSNSFEENIFKKTNNFYKNKKDLDASIFALETRPNLQTFEQHLKTPVKALKVMNKFRQSYRKSKQFWLKTKALEPKQSLTWIMKPLKQIQISDMELAKKLKEKALKEEIFKRIKTKRYKSVRGIKREQNKTLCPQESETKMVLFDNKMPKDSESSLINKWENKSFLKQTFSKTKPFIGTNKDSIVPISQGNANIKENFNNFLTPNKSLQSFENMETIKKTKISHLNKKFINETKRNSLCNIQNKRTLKRSYHPHKSSLESESLESSTSKRTINNKQFRTQNELSFKKSHLNSNSTFSEEKSSKDSNRSLQNNNNAAKNTQSFKSISKSSKQIQCFKACNKLEKIKDQNTKVSKNISKNLANYEENLKSSKNLNHGKSSCIVKRSKKAKIKWNFKNLENVENKSCQGIKRLNNRKRSVDVKRNKSSTIIHINSKENNESFLRENKGLEVKKKLKQQNEDIKQDSCVSKKDLAKTQNKLQENSSSKASVDQTGSHLELKSFSEVKIHLKQHIKQKCDVNAERIDNFALKNESSENKVKIKQTNLKEVKSLKAENQNKPLNNTKCLVKQEKPEKNLRVRRKLLSFQNPLPQTNSVLIHYIKNITKPKSFKTSLNKKTIITDKPKETKSKCSENFEILKENSKNESEDKKQKKHFKERSKLFMIEPILQNYPQNMKPKEYPNELYKEKRKAFKSCTKPLTKDNKFILLNDFVKQDSKILQESSKIVTFYTTKDVENRKINSKKECSSSCYSKTLELLTNIGKPPGKNKILFNKLHMEFAKDPLRVLENMGLQVMNTKRKK